MTIRTQFLQTSCVSFCLQVFFFFFSSLRPAGSQLQMQWLTKRTETHTCNEEVQTESQSVWRLVSCWVASNATRPHDVMEFWLSSRKCVCVCVCACVFPMKWNALKRESVCVVCGVFITLTFLLTLSWCLLEAMQRLKAGRWLIGHFLFRLFFPTSSSCRRKPGRHRQIVECFKSLSQTFYALYGHFL